ncbi:hypothetical protein CR513_41137, partial [Mucuna pruriens]
MVMFHSYGKINPIPVKLPNSISIQSSIAGIVRVTHDLVLLDVLYLLQFQFILLSISKLVKGDPSSKTIDLAKLEDGLYYLNMDGLAFSL